MPKVLCSWLLQWSMRSGLWCQIVSKLQLASDCRSNFMSSNGGNLKTFEALGPSDAFGVCERSLARLALWLLVSKLISYHDMKYHEVNIKICFNMCWDHHPFDYSKIMVPNFIPWKVDVASVTDRALGPMKFLLANAGAIHARRPLYFFASYLTIYQLSRINLTTCKFKCDKDLHRHQGARAERCQCNLVCSWLSVSAVADMHKATQTTIQ